MFNQTFLEFLIEAIYVSVPPTIGPQVHAPANPSLNIFLDILSEPLGEKLSEFGIEDVSLLITQVVLMSSRILGGVIQ